MKSKILKLCLIFAMVVLPNFAYGQQNHSMYLLHYLPESNLLNPAVPLSCKWYVGLPAISSVHANYGNSSFTYKQVFRPTGEGTYETDANGAISRLHFRNYIGTEIHLQLFALAYKPGDYSFFFTITEKNNIPVIYPKEPILLAWKGNSQYEGQNASFKGTGIYFNHYREYTLGISKYSGDGIYYGIKGKLLFGKLNFTSRKTNIDLFTDDLSFALNFEGELNAFSSLPVVIEESDNGINDIYYDESITPMQLALNRKNPGFAIDAGIIYPLTNNIELSASVIDLGFIRWRSNLHSFDGSGQFVYNGPLGNSLISETYFNDLRESFVDSMNFTIGQQKYTSFLPPRVLAGVIYQVNNSFLAGLSAEALIYRNKIIPSLTISGQVESVNNIHLIASYTLQYYNLKSVGIGLVIGRNPVQFYILSDDVPGTIWPLSSRNINLRFGLNINLGCITKSQNSNGGQAKGDSGQGSSGTTSFGKGSTGKGGSGKGQLQGNCYWLEKQIQKEHIRLKRRSR